MNQKGKRKKMANKTLKNVSLRKEESEFVLPKYNVFFSSVLAEQYRPIVYSFLGNSGSPEGLYYRIVARREMKEACIQYYFYWVDQKCGITSHKYDYEPIFVYLKPNSVKPDKIVNGGLGGPSCLFHKNEVRPKTGKRSIITSRYNSTLSPKPYYPFGKTGKEKIHGCYKKYPLKGNNDLKFKGLHSKFGIASCSNVFSGAKETLKGKQLHPPLKELTDKILKIWYFKHDNNKNDMPFGHDVANPFTLPYIKYRSAKKSH